MFAVVIPTLQRSPALDALLTLCSEHPRVAEVVVVNNAPRVLEPRWRRTVILQQNQNIFVNPAWNIGVASSSAPWLAILNDDILFAPYLFDYVARWMSLSLVGIVGLHASDFTASHFHPRIVPEYHRKYGWGTAMFMRRDRYIPVPDQLRIFYGDDWLFNHQLHRNFSLRGVPVSGEISTSSSADEFNPLFEQDSRAWRLLNESPYVNRYRLEERTVRVLIRARDAGRLRHSPSPHD